MRHSRWFNFLTAFLLLAAAGLAKAEERSPWLSVASANPAGQNVEIRGGDLPPGAVVSLRVEAPDASAARFGVTADGSGKFQFIYAASVPGTYSAELIDGAGALLAAASFACGEP